ncbi:S24 family peptidase [Alterisphingorhabdus coralli]|uniref:S24 family peptidase n=1 Tax=Alterisphingorhabdus coralli TaxID=3071408 RepID=A0AA97I0V4_9SPHN|nr:S24 family peptidase [Parasphingorhabdus sp. SCSIO 66989]WOE74718.1 S24 family peptidase [Parasphingorhabdus sp. SCSIO 66989]
MTDNQKVRDTLARLITDRGVSYAGVSDMLGRNPAYIQQFIRRGTPSRLAERDRQLLAQFFGVSEDLLRNTDDSLPTNSAASRSAMGVRGKFLRPIPKLSIGASAGPGRMADSEHVESELAFDEDWLRRQGFANAALNMIRVEGDSMEPTLCDGDDIMVEMASGDTPRRDGVYVLRRDDALMVKRLAFQPDGSVSVLSDNPAYPSMQGLGLDSVAVVGRVVWAGRRL